MKKLLSLLLIICSIGVAYADDKSTVTSLKYVTDELNTRQDKFGANDGKAMTFTNVAGGNAPRDVKSSLGTSTSDNGLPTVSAVNAGLDDKQNTIPAVNTNTVVTYTGVAGTVGQKGIYQDTGTYAAQADNLIDAGTFNAALKTGLDSEFICADTDPVSGNCWLWTIHNEENKNLIDWSQTPTTERVNNGIWSRYNVSLSIQNGDWTCKHSPTLPIGTYTISGNALIYYVVVYNTSEARYVRPTKTGDIWKTTVTLTAPSEIWICSANSSGMAAITQCQIEEGSNATTYQAPTPYTTLLPSGYTPLEYIGASSGQFINTGINPTDQMIIKTDILFTSDDVSVFGGSQNNTNKMQVYKYQKKIFVRFHNQTSSSLQPVISNDNWYSLKIDYSNSYGTINDTTTSIIKTNAEQVTYPIYIWANNVAGTISGGTGGSYIKFFEIRNSDGTNLFYGVPARRNSDNAIGMYDTVSGTFKENAGTGTFTAGPDISNVVYIPQN